MTDFRYFLGVDGGGSTCRARLEDPCGKVLGEAKSGPANMARDAKQGVESLNELCHTLAKALQLPNDWMKYTCVCAGFAGYGVIERIDALDVWQKQFARCQFTTDLHIACAGAHGGKDGAVIILGTGSSAIVYSQSNELIIGGHGFLLGDDASGAWLGMQAVRHALLVADGLHQPNYLSRQLLSAFDSNPADLKKHYMQATPKVFAQLTNAVFDSAQKGDPFAKDLLDKAVMYIAKLHERLSEKTQHVALMGGLAERYWEILPCVLIKKLQKPKTTALDGALLLARDCF